MNILYTTNEDGQAITVAETEELYGEKGRFRILRFSDELIQGAMDLDDPDRIVFEYPRAIIHLMDSNHSGFEDVFLIGHGIGTLSRHYGDARRFKTAEISRTVLSLSQTYFGCDGNGVTIGDGRAVLEAEADGAFDYIVLDAFGGVGTPRHLLSRGFFSLARARLNRHGMLIMNAAGKGRNDRLLQDIHMSIASVFPYSLAFGLPSSHGSDVTNFILAGGFRPIMYKARHMAGFRETRISPGNLIADHPGEGLYSNVSGRDDTPD